MIEDKLRSIIPQYRRDPITGEIISQQRTETVMVSPIQPLVITEEIIYEFNRLTIKNELGNYLIEVFNFDDIETGKFYVNYTSRRVYLDSDMCGKTITLTYWGIGCEYIDSGIIYTSLNSEGKVSQTLKDILESGGTESLVTGSIINGSIMINGNETNVYTHPSGTTGTNPHNTTKTDVGLSNIDNTSDINKPISSSTQTALDLKVDKVTGKSLVLDTEIAKIHDHSNKGILDIITAPYTIEEKTKLDTLSASGSNISDINATDLTDSGDTTLHYHSTDRNRTNHTGTQLSTTISDFASAVRETILTGLTNTTNAVISATDTVLSALGKLQKQIIDNLATLTSHIGNTSNPHSATKAQVGLSNVDNTTDLLKPISTATQSALNLKVDKITGKSLLLDTEITRLSNISSGANKVIDSTTNGNILIDNVETNVYIHPTGTNPHGTTKADVGLGSADNTSDSVKNVLSATKLTTARTINGVNFDGSTNITVADNTKLALSGGTMVAPITYNDTSQYILNLAGYPTWGLYWNTTDNAFDFHAGGVSKVKLDLQNGSVTSSVFNGVLNGNSSTASKLVIPRTIALTGDITGGVSFDGSGDISIVSTIVDDSHNHIIQNIDGLQTALDGKATPTNITDSINAIKIGGNNLILDTATPFTITGTGGVNQVGLLWNIDSAKTASKQITVSYDVVCSTNSGTFQLQVATNPWLIGDTNHVASLTKQHISYTYTMPSTTGYTRLALRLDYLTGTATISNLKIAIGNKELEWTPAIEDMAYKTTNGITSARPTPTHVGQTHFDTTLGKPIWCKTVATPVWVDSTGTTV